jgi:hypothetical protein
VPVACHARFKQKVDAGSRCATIGGRVGPGLAIKTALRVGREIQGIDDVLCYHVYKLGFESGKTTRKITRGTP